MKLPELVRAVAFQQGQYAVEAVLGETRRPLIEFTFDGNDEAQGRILPSIKPHPQLSSELKGPVCNALTRAGIRHPGLADEDLAELHSAARKNGHIELFADINALVQGLVAQIVTSLGARLARIVVSSSSIDVLHEYQSLARHHHGDSDATIIAWELARGMRVLRDLKVPIHIHQLAPGAARYFRRGRADGPQEAKNAPSTEHREELTYIAEDRQMVAAFWNYLATVGPRIPLYLITADLALAHVCAAERVPFVFARAPRELPDALSPEALWFDPYGLALRFCLPHTIIWELCLVFGTINVIPTGRSDERKGFGLKYLPRQHLPGDPEDVALGEVVAPPPSGAAAVRKSPPPPASSSRALKLSLASVVAVLPTHRKHKVPLSSLRVKDEDSIRQLWQVGEATGLFQQQGTEILAGPELDNLLTALAASDYLAVNRIFRKVSAYDRVLQEAEQVGGFPPSSKAGAATGWAVMLGAAYKLPGATTFGLADVTDDQFERAVIRTHADVGSGERAVSLSRVLDRVCSEMRLSPVRFEALLNRSLGQRALRDFEAQRAKSHVSIPAHQVIVAPTSSVSESYLRRISPGEGVTFAGKLVGSLVRRPGGT